MKDPNKALVLNKNKSIQSNIHHAHHWKEKHKTWIRLGETSIRSQFFWLNSKNPMWLHATLEYIRIHGTGIVTYCYVQLVSFSWHVLLLFVVYVDKDSFRGTYGMIITLLTTACQSLVATRVSFSRKKWNAQTIWVEQWWIRVKTENTG